MDASGGQRYGSEHEIACTMTSVLIRLVRRLEGESAVADLLRVAGSDHDAGYLENTDNWISLREAMALMQAGIDVTGDQRLPFRVGQDAVRQHAGTQVATLLRSLGSPEAVLSSIIAAAAKFSTVTDMEALEARPGHAVVRAVARPGYKRSPLHCDWTAGTLSCSCMLFGLPPARVEEVECQSRGGSECRFVVSWDKEAAAAARDPEQRVTALEAQVVAMAQRLESAYATASDLVSPDDLGTVLARIVERAANAVRAPGYVLAVRPGPQDDLRVFSEGLSAEEANQIAAEAGSDAAADNELLCVEVASSRRFYGHLIAIHPAGWRFFSQETQLLALYAKHAAAVLDTAMALQEASRRHQHVSALLSLSQALAQSGTVEEIGMRLSEAVATVVDCDRASVWIWDETGDELRCQGSSAADRLPRTVIRSTEVPCLDEMVERPEALFFRHSDQASPLEAIMTDARLVALAVVPILAHELFLGLLTVGVEHRPDRLRRSPELMEKLEGVAALAATALQNGRLIEELGRQVVHDGLTGVLNRTGFSRTVERVLQSLESRPGQAGLLFVDLDHFKPLNDEYGHQFGDELLCAVASRLRTVFRGDDRVARLGGDEFAVILASVRSEPDLEAAAVRARAAFAEGFEVAGVNVTLSASIGQALAPNHGNTIDELVRRADQAMYREKSLARMSAAR